MKIKREALVRFFRCGFPLLNLRDTAKFHYALQKNIDKIKEVQKEVDEKCISEDYSEYQEAIRKYMIKICEKNEDGSPKMIVDPVTRMPVEYDVPEDKQEEAQKELDKLKEKHKDAISDMEKKVLEHKELLQEEIEFDFFQVDMEYINNINAGELKGIKLMVKDWED